MMMMMMMGMIMMFIVVVSSCSLFEGFGTRLTLIEFPWPVVVGAMETHLLMMSLVLLRQETGGGDVAVFRDRGTTRGC